MKKILMVMATMMAMVMLAGTAIALPFNVRPVNDPPATLIPPHGEQTLGGVGGIFDTIGADTYAADPVNTQSSAAIFTNAGSGGAVASFIISIAGNAGVNVSGMYQYGNTANVIPIFLGGVSAPAQANVTFLANGTIIVTPILGNVQAGNYPGFGNLFGFYLNGPGGKFFSEDDQNAAGNAQALIYQGNGTDVIQVPGFAPGPFGVDEWIIAWEDLPWANADKDFNDLVYIVESINPVPEPATMLLLGSGLIGLAGFARRRFRKN